MRMVLMAGVLSIAACSSGDAAAGNAATPDTSVGGGGSLRPEGGDSRTFPITGFDRVSLEGPDTVRITTGPFAVRAEGPEKLLAELRIERVGTDLRIGRRERTGDWIGGSGNEVTIHVTLPIVRAVAVAGSGDLSLDRATGDFAADNTGSGSIKLAEVRGGAVTLTAAGSGDITAAGRADAVALSVTGSADIDAGELTARRGSVSISGSGNVDARIDGPAAVSLDGSGDADLGPGARCTVSRTGSGEAKCGG